MAPPEKNVQFSRNQNESQNDDAEYNCDACDRPDTYDNMVECEICTLWFHYSCAGVSSVIEESSFQFTCAKCLKAIDERRNKLSKNANTGEASGQADALKAMVCFKCGMEGNAEAIKSCAKCKILCHTTCMENDSSAKNIQDGDDWICVKCVGLKVNGKPQGTHSNASSKLLLLQLEEEKALEQKRLDEQYALDQKFLLRKYELMQADNQSLSGRSVTSVQRWVHANGESQSKIEQQRLKNKKFKQPGPIKNVVVENCLQNANNQSSPINNQLQSEGTSQQAGENLPVLASGSAQNSNTQPRVLGSNTIGENQSLIISNEFSGRSENVPSSSQWAARHASTSKNSLPTFSGDPLQWPVFKSAFIQSTQRCGYTNGDNLERLQKCLQGDALKVVQSLLTFANMVPFIMNTLQRRFGRPEIIINLLVKQVEVQANVHENNLQMLMDFALVVQNLCATVKASGHSAYLNSPTLMQTIIKKLTPSLRLDWAKHRRNLADNMVNLETLNDWLIDWSNAASDVSYDDPQSLINSSNSSQPKKTKGYIQVTSDATSNVQSNANKTVSKCVACDNTGHRVENCNSFKALTRSKRWDTVVKFKLCRRCLGQHYTTRCKIQGKCGTNGCDRNHHPLLHNHNTEGKPSENPTSKNTNQGKGVTSFSMDAQASTSSGAKSAVHGYHDEKSKVLFRVLPVRLHGKKKTINTFAFLDDGSSITLINQDLANQLALDGDEETLCLQWTGDVVREEKQSRKVSLSISGLDDDKLKFRLNNVRTVAKLNLPLQSMPLNDLWHSYEHLKNVPIASYRDATPGILIGVDNYKLSVPLEIKERGWKEPVATKTRLGWVIAGPVSGIISNIESCNFHQCQQFDDGNLHNLINEYFSIENFGIRKSETTLESKHDTRAKNILKNTTQYDGERYESGLLWKDDVTQLPNNYTMALNRHICLEKKMAREPDLVKYLTEQISDYQQKNYIRKLDSTDEIPKSGRSWYLPIFVVRNPNKANKPRIVRDAAAECKGVSLNSLLLKGPESKASSVGILHRFRENPIAISGDIMQMFHQIRVRKQDQYSQMFLWRNGDANAPIDIYAMQVLTFGATCSPATAEYIKNMNAQRFSSQLPRAVNAILSNHYVDDWLESFQDESTAIEVVKQVMAIHRSGGFIMRNWLSNSRNVLKQIGEPELSKNSAHDLHGGVSEKILGMWWSLDNDEFAFKVKPPKIRSTSSSRPTRREALRFVMSTYDPCGIIGFVTVQLKMFMQDLCKISSDWDTQIPEKMEVQWNELVKVMKSIESIRIPRHYFNGEATMQTSVELHTFVDASERAFSAVSYFRFPVAEEFACALIGSKTKVAPNKPTSIPRLELMAAVLGTRFMKLICETHTLNIAKKYMWTDSQTVLQWLNSDARQFKQFVALRVGEILDSTDVNTWRWVPSKQNIADFATKWHPEIANITTNLLWFKGPIFLSLKESMWPKSKFKGEDANACNDTLTELRIQCSHSKIKFQIPIVPYITRFSKWRRLRGALARLYEAAARFKAKLKILKPSFALNHKRCDHIQRAEITLIRLAQIDAYKSEFIQLTTNGSVDKTSNLHTLSPIIDAKGVLRVFGRTEHATYLSIDQRQPIILPRSHCVTHMIIQDYHETFHHSQHETAVNEIRQRFYIPRLRVEFNVIRNQCQRCKNNKVKPQCPEMSPLPVARLAAHTKPFSFVGIDYFGPIEVVVGRRHEKRWGVLFTCLTIRAVHLEMSYSLTSSSCIMAISRFIRCRGWPIEIKSDNGTNFRGASSELTHEIAKAKANELEEAFSAIKWTFITPSAPHMGGAWERLVRSVKSILHEIVPSRRPNDEVLITAFKEVEGIINMRPLTYIPIDPREQEALTPNHFILGSSGGRKIMIDLRDTPELLRRDWKLAQQMADCFWKRFVREYLPTLTRKTKWFDPVPELQDNVVVILCDEGAPRNTWRKAIVVETIAGRDGKVRSARIRTENNELVRPVSKLAKLDVLCDDDSKTVPQ